MDIAEVKTKVDRDISAADVLTLRYQNNELKSASVDAVIQTYFGGTLTGTVRRVNGRTGVIDEGRQQVIYELNLEVREFSLYKGGSAIAAQLTFSISGGAVECSLRATLPDKYKLEDTFSDLKDQPGLPINRVGLQKSVITLQAGATPASRFEATLLRGDPGGPLEAVDWLLPKDLALAGVLDFKTEGGQRIPVIDLSTRDLAAVTFGIFTLKLNVRLRSVVQRVKDEYLFLSYVELVTVFETPNLIIPVVLPLYGEGQYLLSFYLDLAKKPSINGWESLTGFTGGDPKSLLNPELAIGHATLSLDSMSAVLDPYAKRLVSVEIGVSLNLEWTIIGETVELEKIGAVFTINNPGSPKLENMCAVLFAKLRVGSVHLDTSVMLPDRTLMAQLAAGSEIDVNEVIGTFAKGLKLPGNDKLVVDQLDVSAHVKKGEEAYSLEAGAYGNLTIIPGLIIENIHFFIAYEMQMVTEVNLASTLRLSHIDVDLFVHATYDQANGWQFEGATGPGQDIPVGTLIKDLADMFGAVGVPADIEKLRIRDLKTAFGTKSKNFEFGTKIEFGPSVLELAFSNVHQEGATPSTFEKRATGVITVFPGDKDELDFNVGIDLKPGSNHFIALYNNPAGKPIHLGKVVKALYPDYGGPDVDFDITIKDAIAGYVSEPKRAIFALDLGASIDLSSLGTIPLVGPSLSAAKTLRLAVQLIYPVLGKSDTSFPKADLDALNALITVAGPRLPAGDVPKGLSLKTELRLGDGAPINVSLPVTVDQGGGQLKPDSGSFTTAGSQATDDGVQWLQLDKKFGPVNLQRVGLKYDKGAITALLDGGLTAFGLEVDLMGLSVTSTLTDGKVDFGLRGLGIGFSKGGVEIAGALLHLQNAYEGLAIVQAEGLRLAAIGSLTTVQQQPSLFLYAVLDYPLGGSPFFYVTGLAGGFGLNQKLIMPAVDQVKDFPLVKLAVNPPAPSDPSAMPTDPNKVGGFIEQQMGSLRTSLAPSLGQYFGCVGVKFTSFELLNSFVLVSLSFGRETELDLLGISTLVVPPQEPPSAPALAVISLQLAASFIPGEGLAIVQGRLTPDSHLFTLDCHITGGFAFAAWFGKNTNAGDFVVTLGGYHPDFKKPDHYPAVPRIGVNWQICAELSVTGGLYFALTPRALMAGGAMHAIFQVHVEDAIASADIRAWFTLGADFIVYWKPFHYSAHVYIDMGIDIVLHFLGTHDIGLDAAADLDVWGPPFAGRAHISLTIIGIKIGFNVEFGQSAPAPDPLLWDSSDSAKSFRQSFLPKKTEEIVSVAIDAGLVRKIEDDKKTWHVINPKDFRVRTHSVIPIKACENADLRWVENKKQFSEFGSNTEFGVNPMHKGSSAVRTSHQIKVTLCDAGKKSMGEHFLLKPIHNAVPGGLWASETWTDKSVPGINAERLIDKAATGFEIVPDATHVVGPTKSLERKSVAFDTGLPEGAYADSVLTAFTAELSPGNDPEANAKIWNRIQTEIHDANVGKNRAAMLASMGFAATRLDIGELFITDAAYAPSYGSLSS